LTLSEKKDIGKDPAPSTVSPPIHKRTDNTGYRLVVAKRHRPGIVARKRS